MQDHELELIAALVEGRLDDDTEARRLVASSPAHAEEYELQRLAYQALNDLEPATLSDTERSALHRDVWTSLHSRPEAGRTGANPWWYRWTAVAAALLVVGGSAAVLSQNMGAGDSGSDEVFSEMAAPLDEETAGTTIAAAEAPDAGADSAGGSADTSVTTFAVTEDDGSTRSSALEQLFSAKASEVRAGNESAPDLHFYENVAAVDPAITECVARATEAAGLDGFQVVATADLPSIPEPEDDTSTSTVAPTIVASPGGGSHGVAVASPESVEPSEAPLAFVDLAECEVEYLDSYPEE